ncbi:hypothetical protein SAMN02745217_01294 [Anaerocolumna xylanovorans DSM 12503]|uniref:Uncharacterized protein n=2 Tax=Anaerocolumna TaxID=1843210 RepID=A0A1M7Y3Z8_9FIRM|nr:hypothetical protein SAMN02745217_01294 [Anaerocolumna xylanovorans DSM 12503]
MIEGCSKLMFRGFQEAAVKIIAEELNKQMPKTELELANMISEFGATVLVTVVNDTVMVSNMTGVFDDFMNGGEEDAE